MPSVVAPEQLTDGAIVRSAVQADVPAMVALEADREGADDAVDLQLVADTPGGLESMSVVEVDGRIVSMATLLDETVTVGATALPAGQIEMVATARGFEGRGYVRALMQRSHDLSTARGHVVQVMIGIPNFYRQFGYAYSIPMHPWARVTDFVPAQGVDPDTTVATATIDDIPACQGLQDRAQSNFDVTMPHSDDCWRWIMSHTSSKQLVVREANGAPIGLARVYDDGEGNVDVGEVTASSEAATRALMSHAIAAAGPDGTVRVNVRPHVAGLERLIDDTERPEWYYVRVADPAQLLRAMAPELLLRLQTAGHPQGEALISFYRRHLRLAWNTDEMVVTPGGQLQAPVFAGGSGVPLDALGTALFGGGAAALENRWPDALLGRQADLMHALFPPRRADLLTFYLAS